MTIQFIRQLRYLKWGREIGYSKELMSHCLYTDFIYFLSPSLSISLSLPMSIQLATKSKDQILSFVCLNGLRSTEIFKNAQPSSKTTASSGNSYQQKKQKQKNPGIGIRKNRMSEYLCISSLTKKCNVRLSKKMPFNYRVGCLIVGAT